MHGHSQDLRSLVAQPMMRFLFSLQALFDGCKGILTCLWPTGRYRLRHPSFLMYSQQNGAGRMKGEISDGPKTCSGSQACAHSSPASLTLFCCLFSSVISGVACDSARSAPPLQTLHIDSLLIIYRAGQRVCRASSQVLLLIMDDEVIILVHKVAMTFAKNPLSKFPSYLLAVVLWRWRLGAPSLSHNN